MDVGDQYRGYKLSREMRVEVAEPRIYTLKNTKPTKQAILDRWLGNLLER